MARGGPHGHDGLPKPYRVQHNVHYRTLKRGRPQGLLEPGKPMQKLPSPTWSRASPFAMLGS